MALVGRRDPAHRGYFNDVPSPPRVLIATTSRGKLGEWRLLLGDLPYELVSLSERRLAIEVRETGVTFAENARLKAIAYGTQAGLLTLAEDSGLEVAALDGRPGVHSARWEGDDYARKNQLLIDLVAGRRGEERACRYVAVAILRHPDGRTWEARGELRGQIAEAPAGSGGFGYDPIFYVPRYRRTLAQIPIDEKDRISHRGRAARRIREVLRELLEPAAEQAQRTP
jgi:XTP/dITP diphosphohydrolase